jgi:hypothetical protein
MIFTATTFKLVIAMMRLENREFIVSLVWLFQYPKSSGYFSSTSRKSLDGAVMMMCELLLQSPATTTENFWCQVDVGMCSK